MPPEQPWLKASCPGGGIALLRAAEKLESVKLPAEQEYGMKILRRAMSEPIRQLAENSGLDGSVLVNKVLESKEPNFGYNGLTSKFEDLLRAGVIDPTKVVRSALQNATSIASLLLTTEVAIVSAPKKPVEPNVDNLGPDGPNLID